LHDWSQYTHGESNGLLMMRPVKCNEQLAGGVRR
jgi:hypothetical protein